MSKVFFGVGVTLDGHVAGPNRGHSNPLEEGGETGPDDRIVDSTFKRTGANIMGKRMFDGVDPRKVSLDVVGATHSPLVTHVNYRVRYNE